jgi:homoserine dehydrogenase
MANLRNSAKDAVIGAIRAGKHVVTANKALIAEYLPEIQKELAANPSVR